MESVFRCLWVALSRSPSWPQRLSVLRGWACKHLFLGKRQAVVYWKVFVLKLFCDGEL